MCGRYSLTASPQEVAEFFELDEIDEFPPRYNIAPTQPVLMVSNGPAGKRAGQLVRWGLVPSWVKDPADFTLLINARAETAAEKPSFRNAMRHRRTLVPASGFYEWHRPAEKGAEKGAGKQAWWIRPADGGIVAFAGLMETWHDKTGSEIDSGCILTTQSNAQIGNIHHRMPVVIRPQDFAEWLDCANSEPRDVAHLLRAVEDGFFEAIPVSDKVNKVANSGPDIQQRAEPARETPDSATGKEDGAGQGKLAKPGSGQYDLF